MTAEKQLTISRARVLAIKWVYMIEFGISPDTHFLILGPTTVQRLDEILRSKNKHPMEWTEKECIDFVIGIATNHITKEIPTPQKG